MPHETVGIEDLSYILGRLLAEKEHLYWHPAKKLVWLSETPAETVDLNLLMILEQEILRSFSQSNYMDVLGKLDQYFSFFQQHQVPFGQYKSAMERIIIGVFSISSKYDQALSYLKILEKLTDADEIFRMMNDMIQEFSPQLPHNSIVKMAIEYIEQHYNEQISLNNIAKYCSVSPSYISKIFKSHINIGIVQYIHNIRIENAKQLILNSDLKVSEIAAAVGYLDYKRFSSYFLKITGMSPRDFKLSNQDLPNPPNMLK